MTSIYKLSVMLNYCRRYPDHVKAMYDSRNGNYHPIPLACAIGDNSVLPTMSTYLPVVVCCLHLTSTRLHMSLL